MSGPRPQRVNVARMRRHMERDRARYFWTRDEHKHPRDDVGVSR